MLAPGNLCRTLAVTDFQTGVVASFTLQDVMDDGVSRKGELPYLALWTGCEHDCMARWWCVQMSGAAPLRSCRRSCKAGWSSRRRARWKP